METPTSTTTTPSSSIQEDYEVSQLFVNHFENERFKELQTILDRHADVKKRIELTFQSIHTPTTIKVMFDPVIGVGARHSRNFSYFNNFKIVFPPEILSHIHMISVHDLTTQKVLDHVKLGRYACDYDYDYNYPCSSEETTHLPLSMFSLGQGCLTSADFDHYYLQIFFDDMLFDPHIEIWCDEYTFTTRTLAYIKSNQLDQVILQNQGDTESIDTHGKSHKIRLTLQGHASELYFHFGEKNQFLEQIEQGSITCHINGYDSYTLENLPNQVVRYYPTYVVVQFGKKETYYNLDVIDSLMLSFRFKETCPEEMLEMFIMCRACQMI